MARTPNRAASTSSLARRVEQTQKSATHDGRGLNTRATSSRSYEEACSICKAKVAAIVDECQRLNQRYRDNLFDVEGWSTDTLSSLNGEFPSCVDKIGRPPWIKRIPDIFDDPKFIVNGASADEVVQGNAGDCWFLAALMSISAKPDLLHRICVARDEKAGVYAFVFYRDGEWVSEVVDDRLYLRVGDDDDLLVVKASDEPAESSKSGWNKAVRISIKHDMEKLRETLQKGGEALYFARCRSSETWLPLIEKAYAKAHGDYMSIEGGWVSEGIEDLTGGVAVTLNPEDIMCKDRFWKTLLEVNKDYLFGGGSKNSESHGMIGGHAYTVLQVWEEGDLRLLKIKNPWGEQEWDGAWSDGSEKWTPKMMEKLNHRFGDDGVFWMSYEDFLKHFPVINRTRLFGPEWTITQQWTSVNVPWTVDYLDTKFEVTIGKAGPVVIVLSQPDDRYFHGLRGRYYYSLHFRVYSSTNMNRYLVRSMHNSGGESTYTRSVSAEVDLEPGTYSILIKITPYRMATAQTCEEQIKAICVRRKEKLLSIGRNFDLAHSKGRLREKEKANRRAAMQEDRDRRRNELQRAREARRLEKERAKKRSLRITHALEARRKEAEIKRAEALIGVSRQSRHGAGSWSQPSPIEKAGFSHSPTNRVVSDVKDEGSSIVMVEQSMASASIAGEDGSTNGLPVHLTDEDGAAQLGDDDFDWDSTMDGSVDLTSDEEQEDLHEDDPWNAICVLGLRVYSKTSDTTIRVVDGESSDA